jgi:hypothetical protein
VILSFLKTVNTTATLNKNQSTLSDLYPIILTLIVLIAVSAVFKIIEKKKTTKI